MPANSRVFLKPFIGGLNTEGSDVDDMVLNTSDELNCTILPEQMRGRRYGFNIERDGEWYTASEPIVAHSLYSWNNVYADTNFIVVQINRKLYIYPDRKPLSGQDPLWTYDLTVNQTMSQIEPVSMTSVSGSLFVVARWMFPIVIKYDEEKRTFSVSENNLKFRDFTGVDDGLKVDEMPTTMSALHRYNLENQGWDKTVYNADNNTSKTLLPSTGYNGLFYEEYAAEYGSGKYPANNMQWFLGKENSGKYNTTDLLNTYFGNTPAPKGHFILDYKTRSRSLASNLPIDTDSPSVSGLYYSKKFVASEFSSYDMTTAYFKWITREDSSKEVIAPKLTTNFNYTYNMPSEICGVLTKFTITLTEGFNLPKQSLDYFISEPSIGGPGRGMTIKMRHLRFTPKQIRAGVIGESRAHNDSYSKYIFASSANSGNTFRIRVYGYDDAGTATLLHTATSLRMLGNIGTTNTYEVSFSNTTSYKKYAFKIDFPNLDYSHKWIVPDYLDCTLNVDKLNWDAGTQKNFEGLPSNNILRGALTDVESFGGRVFYLCGDSVLFSQTLRDGEKYYDLCYQDADPTSEEVSDIIATDGGVIKLLSLGRGKALKSFYRGVLVFGDEEVTGILSNSINLFSAESYDVVKISKAGLTSKYSVVETDDAVFYWSNHGIYVVTIDENNNISANCISLNTIQNWYNNLSQFSRDNCVGYYDFANNRIYWFYPTLEADKLDGCLVYDISYNSFMPQEIDAGHIVRDLKGNYVGKLNAFKQYITYKDGSVEQCDVTDNSVSNVNSEVIGYNQNKYLTDCQESSSVYEINPTIYLRANGNKVVAGDYNVVAKSFNSTEYDRKSAGIFLISDGNKYSFGDFNDREFRDWDVSPYESYLVSRPITLGDTYFNKQTPVMQTLFKRTEEDKLNPTVFYQNLYTSTYHITPIVNTDRAGSMEGWPFAVWKSISKVLNKGMFRKAKITFDLEDYDSSSALAIEIRGYVPGHGESVRIVKTVEYAVAGNQMKEVELTIDDSTFFTSTDVFDSFDIITNTSAHPTEPIRVFIDFEIERTALFENIFKGYEEKTYTGSATLTELSEIPFYAQGATNVWEAGISSEEGYIKDGTLTTRIAFSPRPSYNSNTSSDNVESMAFGDWSASEIEIMRANGLHTGVNGIPDKQNSTIYNTAYRDVEGSNWKIVLQDLTYNTEVARLPQITVDYTYTVYVPKFEKLHIVSPAEYISPSGAYIRMRWGWSVNPLSNRWDMVQNGYRPQKDFLHDDYVESRMHIRGRGKAFQVEVRNDENKDFRLTGLNIITRSPQ